MRLNCPNCAAIYEVDDSAVPASGRRVRCAACDTGWRVSGDGATVKDEPGARIMPPPVVLEQDPEPSPAAEPTPDVVEERVEDPVAETGSTVTARDADAANAATSEDAAAVVAEDAAADKTQAEAPSEMREPDLADEPAPEAGPDLTAGGQDAPADEGSTAPVDEASEDPAPAGKQKFKLKPIKAPKEIDPSKGSETPKESEPPQGATPPKEIELPSAPKAQEKQALVVKARPAPAPEAADEDAEARPGLLRSAGGFAVGFSLVLLVFAPYLFRTQIVAVAPAVSPVVEAYVSVIQSAQNGVRGAYEYVAAEVDYLANGLPDADEPPSAPPPGASASGQ